ncbi:uncharacterized protein LOC106432581 isoform X1 [Brassica napus]|uniref:uncharacterized protein LOC106432581 isoform X1 n=2 Tax=Brassica napus TaxID=3708 RepID=UPI0006AAC1FD|nr:uncharacterized protein LOC106432581 isoform X1 [Brassica napus]XP_022554393.1 uncharacterized protein LOC106432581 isoform X1 [Brassica napus]
MTTVVPTSEEDSSLAIVRFTSQLAWADAGPEAAEPQVTRLCREAEESIVAGRWLDLATLMVTSADLVSSKISDKDLECTYTTICSLVKNVNSPEEVLEMVKVIASKVVQQPNDKASLRLKILFNLYNLLDHPNARFQVYMKALELAVSGKVTESIVPSFKKVDSFLKEWNIEIKDQRELFLAIANVLRENKSLAKESLQFVTRYLATFSNEDAHVLSEAKDEAVRAAIDFIKAPSIFQCDLLDMPAVAQLEKDPNSALVYQLLKIFITQRLDAYMEFQNANSGFLQTYGLVEEDCVAKMRLLSLVDLASDESGKIPYASIKNILQVNDEEVELWVVKAISAKLVDCKMDQMNQFVIISRYVECEFGQTQWQSLRTKLAAWRISSTMANMPMDIVNDVFLRLPASTLVRCRVLSKPWFTLIDNSDFLASHLKRTLETEEHLMILLQSHRLLRTVYLDGPDKLSDVDHPLQTGNFTKVFGSVNGMIGLTNSPVVLALFNPSTRTIHRLPIEPIDFSERSITLEYVFYGLGYDSMSDDYKVVRMVQSKHKDYEGYPLQMKGYPVETKVFSLKSNSWKRIHLCFEVQIPFMFFYYHVLYRRGNGVLASNSLHWVLPGNPLALTKIMRFDLATDDLSVLSGPLELCHEVMNLGVLDGCLCLICHDYHNIRNGHVDVWILREYGGSWSKFITVPKPETVVSFKFVRPLIYSKDRSKILLEINSGKLMWFDLVDKSFETLEIKGCKGPRNAEILVSSLVLGCKSVSGRAPEKRMLQKGNKSWFAHLCSLVLGCRGDPREKEIMVKGSKRGGGFLSKGFKLKF